MSLEARVIHETASVDARTLYDFAREMTNLPKWASGLAAGIDQRGDRWFAKSPMGEVEIEMAPENDFGVLDHDVTLPDGSVVHNAFRVSPAGDGCVMTFVVLRAANASDDAFEADAGHVRKDLKALARLVEAV